MKVQTKKEAWAEADKIMPTDYMLDEARTARAGYDIYYSTAEGVNAYICDLGDRLEVNTPDGKSVNIWYDAEVQYSEWQIKDALAVINDAIYEIDDKVNRQLAEATGIKEARDKLYAAYAEIAKILKEQHPQSELYDQYNLKDA